MKKTRLFCLILAVCMVLSMMILPVQGEEPSSAPTESVQEQVSSDSSNRWIFFLITSGLSLAVAIPLAIRSGNKKYGK